MRIFSTADKNTELLTIEDWFKHCPPAKGEKQWKDKRSAKEMAVFWLNKKKQIDFLNYIAKATPLITLEFACPEYSTPFDQYRSPRKNDFCIFANDNNKKVLITIEGKADESFGNNYLHAEWVKSINEKLKRNESNLLNRIVDLYNRFHRNSEILNLRYQLLFWLAGTLEEAKKKKISTVFLIVQEFCSDETDRRKLTTNEVDLNNMLRFISENKVEKIDKNEIAGPFNNKYTAGINIYIGKYTVNLN